MAKASEWRKRIAEWRTSGLSAVKFAEKQGYAAHQVWYWAAKFREEEAAPPAETARTAAGGPMVTRRSIPLARVLRPAMQESAEKPAAPAGAMAVEAGGIRLVVPSGFDRRTLAMVLDEVEARKSRLGGR
jgi:transposase